MCGTLKLGTIRGCPGADGVDVNVDVVLGSVV